MLPCGRAVGIFGVLPHAGSCGPCVSRRIWSAAPPINATMRAKPSEKFNALFPCKQMSLKPLDLLRVLLDARD
jgi:hypothetical protein